ncbi:MAG: U32 family peptidase [Bacteroidales bacterium]|nr:U32 family peptidase [Bacteroidales bacterium]
MERKDIELMVPAGSYESLVAAIQGGADAVYFGVEKLNMRARSSFNFTVGDLERIVDIAKDSGVNTYLTLNTIIYGNELNQVKEIISRAKNADISAIIASDQSVISAAREKNLEVHLSTQLNISNIESLKFYSPFADVVVLARELSLSQITDIASQVKEQFITGPSGELIRIELFIHGALCMAISGKCYMSLHQYNKSANRGECLQACRRSYLVTEKETDKELEIENEFIMSPKDLCTISFLDQILDAGVRVLKIEGRARSPEYVKTVTSCYAEAIEAYLNKAINKDKINHWTERLSSVFNRGFWDGYYLGQTMGEWSQVYGSAATKRKIYLGKGMNYFDRIQVAEFLMETGSLNTGDEILITGPTTGVIQMPVTEIRVDDKQVQRTKKGEHFSIRVEEVIRRSDRLYKLVDSNQVKKQ